MTIAARDEGLGSSEVKGAKKQSTSTLGNNQCSGTVSEGDDLPAKRQMRAWDELKNAPWDIIDTFRWENIRSKGYPWWRKGDADAFFALWGDNLGTQLVLISLFNVPGVPITRAVEKIMPGVGLSLLIGNMYYAFQASKIARRENRTDVCAQPYGINTPGALTKTFVIFQPTFYYLTSKGLAPEEAFDQALQAVCACNFLSAVFEILGAFLFPFIADRISSAALLTPIAGIGMTWLGVNQIQEMVHIDPMVGLFSFVIVWFGTFGNGKLASIPMGLLSIVMGTVIAWGTQATRSVELLTKATESIGFHYGSPGICFQDWSRVGENLALLLPIAMTNALGSLECVRSAQECGDNYNSIETMLADGVGSMVGAMFGSPFGTTVYLGHPAYKKMGGSRGYSLLNGILFFIIGISGFHAILDAIIPREAVVPLVAFVGIMMASETIEITPRRWRPAILLGMLIPVFDWSDVIIQQATYHVLNPLGKFQLTSSAVPFEVGAKIPCVNNFDFITTNSTTPTTIGQCIGTDLWKAHDKASGFFTPASPGIKLMRNGFLFISLLWTLGFISITDRRMLKAGFIWCMCSALSFFGVIHANKLGVPHGATGNGRDGKEYAGWMFICAYLMMAAFCFLIHALQRFGYSNGPVRRSVDSSSSPRRTSALSVSREEDEDEDDISDMNRRYSISSSRRASTAAVVHTSLESSTVAVARMDSIDEKQTSSHKNPDPSAKGKHVPGIVMV